MLMMIIVAVYMLTEPAVCSINEPIPTHEQTAFFDLSYLKDMAVMGFYYALFSIG
jgi:hypothetical protein